MSMSYNLIVAKPFNGLFRGDLISDPNRVREIIDSEYSRFVTKVSASEAAKG